MSLTRNSESLQVVTFWLEQTCQLESYQRTL